MMVDPTFTMSDVWQDIAVRYNLTLAEHEDNSNVQTTLEFAERYGITEYRAFKIIKSEVRAGRAKVTEKRITCFGGARTQTVQAYDFTKEKTDD